MLDGRFRKSVDRCVRPFGAALGRTRVSPDHLTAAGLVLSVPAAVAIGTGHLGLGLALLILAAVPDLLDGALAKASGRASTRGAFFDSVADRVSDSLVLGGVAWYLQGRDGGDAFALPVAVLAASLLVSYQRAKAESLGFEAKGGLMERAERIVAICAGLAFSVLLVPVLVAMLALTLLTAGQRFVKVWRQAGVPPPAERSPARRHESVPRAGVRRGWSHGGGELSGSAARWRAWREAGGWRLGADRYAGGSRRGGAAARWRERRLQRAAGSDGSSRTGSAPGGRRGSRRP